MAVDRAEKVREIPPVPGVYVFKSKSGEVLYVGKASSLKKRVRQHFAGRGGTLRSQALIEKISRLDWEVTSSVAEALLREAALIKEYQPRYNVRLKDDKSYPYLLISNEDYPRITLSRKTNKDALKGRYIGPFTNTYLLRQALRRVREIFPFRVCSRMSKRACLDYRLGLCPGPCIGEISPVAYRALIQKIILFISGNKKKLMERLSQEMKSLSSRKKFEEAARLRDKITSLASLGAHKKRAPKTGGLEEIRKILKKTKPINWVEVYDVSNIAGQNAVGSLVSFFRTEPQHSNYRRFRIREVAGIDDYAMMKEIIRRRFAPRPRMKSLPFPDLIIIDGGRGHLNVILKELKDLGLKKVSVVALAKKKEALYLPARGEPLILPVRSPAILRLRRMRDEAHRFALSYHRYLRRKTVRISALDGIPGIGETRKRKLLKYFGSLSKIRRVKRKELLKVVDRRTASNIMNCRRDESR